MEDNKNLRKELQVLEKLRPILGTFFRKRVYGEWGLEVSDVRLVDEAGFGYSGIPIYGPEIAQDIPHIDIAVLEEKYKGPKSKIQEHPHKLLFPRDPKTGNYFKEEIYQKDKLDVDDLLKGDLEFFALPTIKVDLGGVEALVPEPVSHVEYFANDTILFYTLDDVGENKLKEWFMKLFMIKSAADSLGKKMVAQAAQEAIIASIRRWRHMRWNWLFTERASTNEERVSFD